MIDKLEIERKFLLKAKPDLVVDEIIKINQFYFKNSEGIWERARSYKSNINGLRYIHTVKKRVSELSNIEEEYDMTKEEFEAFKRNCRNNKSYSKNIKKERWCYNVDGLVWEVDVFSDNCHIIIAEVEIPSEDYNLEIPEIISKKILMEVSGQKQFSNRSLANKLK